MTEEKGFWHKTKEVTNNLWDGTKEVTSDVWEGTKNVTEDVWDGTKSVAGSVKNVFTKDDDRDENMSELDEEIDYIEEDFADDDFEPQDFVDDSDLNQAKYMHSASAAHHSRKEAELRSAQHAARSH